MEGSRAFLSSRLSTCDAAYPLPCSPRTDSIEPYGSWQRVGRMLILILVQLQLARECRDQGLLSTYRP